MDQSPELPPVALPPMRAREEEPTEPSDRGHLLDYVRVLYRRRRTALSVFFVTVAAGIGYTWTAIPMYEARARLLIESEYPKVIAFQEVMAQDRNTNEYAQTQHKILQSRALAERTIKALSQEDQAKLLAGARPSGVRRAVAAIEAVVTERFNRREASTPAPPTALDAFQESLTVSPVERTRLVDVVFKATDPQLAANAANTLASSYIEHTLAKQRKLVEASELALQRYREQRAAVVSGEDRQNVMTQKLTDLNTAVTRAKTERIAKQTVYNQLRAIENDPVALASFPLILANPFIQQLKAQLVDLQRQQVVLSQRFGEKHPEMTRLQPSIDTAEARLRGEVAKVAQTIAGEFLAAQAQERNLTAALEAQNREAIAMRGKAIEYDVLERNLNSDRQIFDTLLQRAKETDVSAELRTNNIRVVDPAAVPKAPYSPKKYRNLLLALVGGLGLGAALAFFLEYLDQRIKSPDDIKVHLGLPFLGMVPAVPGKSWAGSSPLINNGVPATFGEAFRVVRTNILFTFPHEGGHSLLVTSVGPSEGKTLVACNLAVALAQAGQRVLLLDADLRRPRMHEVFNQAQEPGLSTLIGGEGNVSKVLRQSSVPGLWIIPAGPLPRNPADLLLSPRFREFLIGASKQFNWVILDSPPVMPVTDASVIAHMVSGVLFVVGADMTSREAAQVAVGHLDAARTPFVGSVLNRVDLDRNAFYFAPYYYRHYDRYYTQASLS